MEAVQRKTMSYSERGRLGALERYKRYGNPGTPDGRKKGGLRTIAKFRLSGASMTECGFKIGKSILLPERGSLLAEFCGIVMGDGSLSKYQIRVSTNSLTDGPYSRYIVSLIKDLFGLTATISVHPKNTTDIVISSKAVVDFLLENGLCLGNKTAQQIGVPSWIMESRECAIGCLRGLVDTDGGIYFHNHVTKGIRYRHIGLCYTTHSTPLLLAVHRMCLEAGIAAKCDRKRHVSVYGKSEINKYFMLVGTNNPKHYQRFRSYQNSVVN